jgi:hypothetical protein
VADGASSLYTGSPLRRRLGNIHAMTQHFLVPNPLTTPGAVFADQHIDAPVF